MTNTGEVVVLGGGVVGSAVAYELARNKVKVTLIDATHAGQATAAGAGIVAPGTSLATNRPNRELSYQAASYYPDLIAQLKDAGAGDVGYAVVGSLFVAMNADEAARLTVLSKLYVERHIAGAPNLGDVSLLTRDAAQALFPPLGDVMSAVYIPGAARLNGRRLRDALRRAAQQHGARVVCANADLVCEGGALKGVRFAEAGVSQGIAADLVVAASGAWSHSLTEATGIDVPIEPQKGQILHLDMPADTDAWPIIQGFHSHYMLSFPGGRVVAGATREDNSGFDTLITAGGMQEVLGEALRIAPGLATGTVAEMRVGLRPASPDRLPILGPVPGLANLFLATGHGANGLTAGAYSGIAVARKVLGQTVDIDWDAFSVARFMR